MADVTISQLTNTTPTTNSILPISKNGITQSTTLAQLSSLPFIPKAWVNFDGVNMVIKSSFNVKSIARVSTGKYTITFDTPMSNTDYVVNVSSNTSTNNGFVMTFVQSPTINSVVVAAGYQPYGVEAYYNSYNVHVVVYGN
jgi:hypothetical protein